MILVKNLNFHASLFFQRKHLATLLNNVLETFHFFRNASVSKGRREHQTCLNHQRRQWFDESPLVLFLSTPFTRLSDSSFERKSQEHLKQHTLRNEELMRCHLVVDGKEQTLWMSQVFFDQMKPFFYQSQSGPQSRPQDGPTKSILSIWSFRHCR